MRLDLHTHSTASDGQYRPAELVRMAKENELELYALTDHDSISGLDEAFEEAMKLSVRFIPGIEISCQDTEEIHIVGLNIDRTSQILTKKCESFQNERLKRGEKICEYLQNLGMNVDYGEVKKFAKDGLIARPLFAKYLQEHGMVKTRKEAFDLYLDTEDFKEKTERAKPSCKEAIDLIHDAGGVAILAHPGIYKMSLDEKKSLMKRLVEFGIDGVECFYSQHSKEETELFYSWILDNDLKVSIGSDFHGPTVKPGIKIGMTIDMERYRDRFILGDY